MIPFKQIPVEIASKIEYILCDIDDTITTEGKLSGKAYQALWNLQEQGYKVIPVTGRPAGWCDMIVRQWPVAGVVGENGAFVYYFEDGQRKTYTHPSVAEGDVQGRLEKVKQACLSGVSGCRVSKDQFARIYDVAIDFNEDPPYLGFEAAEKIKEICESHGAIAKVSSIHVNTWFGDYNKVSMATMFLENILGEEAIQDKVLFFGDSPNDEPMFAYFKNSCAVANIKPFLDTLTHLPAYIAPHESGEGFTACVDHLLALKKAKDEK